MKLKHIAVAAVLAMSASLSFANAVETVAFDGDGNLHIDSDGVGFSDLYTFVMPFTGNILVGGVTSQDPEENLSFTSVYLQKVGSGNAPIWFTHAAGDLSGWSLGPQTLTGGTYEWHIDGTNPSGSNYVGDLSVVALVPEPETYGMMLAGLGLVGFAARRRSAR